MADPKNVIVEIKNSLVDVRREMNLLKQDTIGWSNAMSSGVARMGGGGGGGGGSSSLVAPTPKFTPPASESQRAIGGPSGGGAGGNGNGNSNIVAQTPALPPPPGNGYTGNTNYTRYLGENPAAGFLYAAAVTGGIIDQPGESVEAQLLMSRAGMFNSQTYDQINSSQAQLAKQGTIKDKMDVMRGLAAAQGAGITGPNVNAASGGMASVSSGVAAVSNLLPGAGFEGTMRAYASMQQGRNVNMLRGIGIRLRDEQGNLKPPDQIIDDIWQKICRDYAGAYGSGKKPSKQEVLIGLQPGNSMDSMLDMYFGNDPMAKQLVANGLIYKAETGGGAISKDELQRLGATTTATLAFSNRNAAAARQTGLTANAGAQGYTAAANTLSDISNTVMTNDLLRAQVEGITQMNATFKTFLGAANDTGGKAMAALIALGGRAGALIGAVGTAIGGVGAAAISGQGANETTSNYMPTETPDEWAKSLLVRLGANPNDQDNIDAIKIWIKKESGATWGKGAKYNPLNTTLGMEGATNFNKVGVKNYLNAQQGVEATAQTLLGRNSKSRGYDRIVSLLQQNASRQEIINAISDSSWAGAGGYSDNLAGITPSLKTPTANTYNNNLTINVEGGNVAEQTVQAVKDYLEKFSALDWITNE